MNLECRPTARQSGWTSSELEKLYRLLSPLFRLYQGNGDKSKIYQKISHQLQREGVDRAPTQVQKRLCSDNRRMKELLKVTRGQVEIANLPRYLVPLYKLMFPDAAAQMPDNFYDDEHLLDDVDEIPTKSGLDQFLLDGPAAKVEAVPINEVPLNLPASSQYAENIDDLLNESTPLESRSDHLPKPTLKRPATSGVPLLVDDYSDENAALEEEIMRAKVRREQLDFELLDQKLRHEAERHELEVKFLKAKLERLQGNQMSFD